LSPLRTSSIFSAPIRPITGIKDYGQANSESKRLSGKGLSKQSFNITPKIHEVDQLMNSHAKARGMIREVHPEVCFYGLAGCRPMRHGKKTKEGFAERLDLLANLQPELEQVVKNALALYPRKMVAPDDILDALVCAITARLDDHWKTVPTVPEVDSKGLPMEMVYCEL
jgi:predicted RNase H-like nuclease